MAPKELRHDPVAVMFSVELREIEAFYDLEPNQIELQLAKGGGSELVFSRPQRAAEWFDRRGQAVKRPPPRTQIQCLFVDGQGRTVLRTFDRKRSGHPIKKWVYVFEAGNAEGDRGELRYELSFGDDGKSYAFVNPSDRRKVEADRHTHLSLEVGKHYYLYLASYQLPPPAVDKMKAHLRTRAIYLWDDFYLDAYDKRNADARYAKPFFVQETSQETSKEQKEKLSFVLHLPCVLKEAQRRAGLLDQAISRLHKTLASLKEEKNLEYDLAKRIELFTSTNPDLREIVGDKLYAYLNEHDRGLTLSSHVAHVLCEDLITWLSSQRAKAVQRAGHARGAILVHEGTASEPLAPTRWRPSAKADQTPWLNWYSDAIYDYSAAPLPVTQDIAVIVARAHSGLAELPASADYLRKALASYSARQKRGEHHQGSDEHSEGNQEKEGPRPGVSAVKPPDPDGGLGFVLTKFKDPNDTIGASAAVLLTVFAKPLGERHGEGISVVGAQLLQRGLTTKITEKIEHKGRTILSALEIHKATKLSAEASVAFGHAIAGLNLFGAINKARKEKDDPWAWAEVTKAAGEYLKSYHEAKETKLVLHAERLLVGKAAEKTAEEVAEEGLKKVSPLARLGGPVAILSLAIEVHGLQGVRDRDERVGHWISIAGAVASVIAATATTGGAAAIVAFVGVLAGIAGTWWQAHQSGAAKSLRYGRFGNYPPQEQSDRKLSKSEVRLIAMYPYVSAAYFIGRAAYRTPAALSRSMDAWVAKRDFANPSFTAYWLPPGHTLHSFRESIPAQHLALDQFVYDYELAIRYNIDSTRLLIVAKLRDPMMAQGIVAKWEFHGKLSSEHSEGGKTKKLEQDFHIVNTCVRPIYRERLEAKADREKRIKAAHTPALQDFSYGLYIGQLSATRGSAVRARAVGGAKVWLTLPGRSGALKIERGFDLQTHYQGWTANRNLADPSMAVLDE